MPGGTLRVTGTQQERLQVKALIYDIIMDVGNSRVHPAILFYLDDGTVIENQAGSIDVDLFNVDDQNSYQTQILTAVVAYAVSQSYSIDQYIWGAGMNGLIASLSFANPSRTLNSAFQISSARAAQVSYAVEVSCALTLVTGQQGTVYLEYADDSGFTTNVVEVNRFVNGNTGTLAIGLALTQIATGTLAGIIPAGKYVRLRTQNNTGTPTFTFRRSQEVLV